MVENQSKKDDENARIEEEKYFKLLREPSCMDDCNVCPNNQCMVPNLISMYNIIARKSHILITQVFNETGTYPKNTDPRVGVSLEEILESSEESPNYARITVFQLEDLGEIKRLPDGNFILLKTHTGWEKVEHFMHPKKRTNRKRKGWSLSK
jgi:hypothetical protein